MSWYTKWKEEVKSKKSSSKKSASSYWYDTYDTSFDYLEEYGDWGKTKFTDFKKTHDLYKLASVRRAIANFVQIVTQKSIPVTYATKSDSKTDGKRVILSADVNDKFDVSVGLALHEGSHIVLSDFKLLQIMQEMFTTSKNIVWQTTNENKKCEANGASLTYPSKASYDDIYHKYIKNYPTYTNALNDIYLSTGKIGSKGNITEEVFNVLNGLTNWIEDRRIDNFIFKSAPGYRDYYTSMYDHYFNDKVVTKGIASDEYTDEDWESYMFRIINLMNENTDLSKLKGLRSVYRKLDLKNINRLQSSNDSLNLAIDVVSEILKYVPMNPQESQKQGGGKGEGDSESGEQNPADVNETGEGEDNQMGGAPSNMGSQGEESTEETDGDSKTQMSKTAKQQLDKKYQKQKDFINGDIKKKSITKQENDKLDSIDESGTELVRVGSDYQNHRGEKIGKGVDCIVVKRLTDKILSDSEFPFTSTDWKTGEVNRWATTEVNKGIVLGTILGKKLQLRGETRETIFSRLKKGKIDARMIASLGYDNENVFYTNEVDQYKKANLHISIDYSGSMSGEKLRKAIVSTTAIVKACSMARNVAVQVSIRSTEGGGKSLPYIAVIYDSRKDSFKTFCKYISSLNCSNTTPEGLCFEAIQKQLIPTDTNVDSYFLNMSDGQPYYSIGNGNDSISYCGENAAEHTNRQVKKMQSNGINLLSYFITERASSNFEDTEDWRVFKKCYGTDAKFVDTNNVFQIAKTMNELFLKKS
jgi:hypothetical protein